MSVIEGFHCKNKWSGMAGGENWCGSELLAIITLWSKPASFSKKPPLLHLAYDLRPKVAEDVHLWSSNFLLCLFLPLFRMQATIDMLTFTLLIQLGMAIAIAQQKFFLYSQESRWNSIHASDSCLISSLVLSFFTASWCSCSLRCSFVDT